MLLHVRLGLTKANLLDWCMLDASRIIIEPPQRTGEDHRGIHAQPGSAIFLTTSHHLTWSWQTQLKIDHFWRTVV